MRIERARYLELTSERRTQIDEAAWAEFEQYALVRETEWAKADWTWLAFDDDQLVAYYNLVDRQVHIDGVIARAAGLNNMVTLPTHRGRGYASRLLRETQTRWFAEGAECGMLLCADPLVAFYGRLGWQRTAARVVYAQPHGQRTWMANCMLLDPRGAFESPNEIDLCGLPW